MTHVLTTRGLEVTYDARGAHVIGIDIAEEQIVAARQLTTQEHLDIYFDVSTLFRTQNLIGF